MKYHFIIEQLKNLKEQKNSDLELIKSYRQRIRFTSIVRYCIFVLLILIGYLAFTWLLFDELYGFFYSNIGLLVTFIVCFVVILTNKSNKKVSLIIKWIVIMVFYSYHLGFVLYNIYVNNPVQRLLRVFYLLQINSYLIFLVFAKMKIFMIIIFGLINFVVVILVQHYYPFPFPVEFVMAIVIPAAAVMSRLQFEGITKTISEEVDKSQRFSNYIENLISDFPSSFLIYSDDKIIDINNNFWKLLEQDCNLNSTSPNLQPDNSEDVRINVSKNIHLLTQNYLETKYLIYSDPVTKDIIDIPLDLNMFTILGALNKQTLNEGKFYFLGIIGTPNDEEKPQYNFHFRKMRAGDTTWIEATMNDVTVSQKVKLIEKIHTIRENLLSKVAHEFKTPLICVTGLADEISQDLESNNKNDVLTKIKDVSNLSSYILFLINDVVNFFSKKTNTYKVKEDFDMKKEKIYLTDILKFCFDILNSLLKYQKNKVRLVETSLESNFECVIFSDPFRIKQILLNLVSNAVKFTRSGYIRITTELFESNIVVSVEDTGTGISESDIRRIFTQEIMLDKHSRENEMGSGLGLSISYQIANLCGFDLTCSSKEGVGSKFSLSIPINEENIIQGNTSFKQTFSEGVIINSNLNDSVITQKIDLPNLKLKFNLFNQTNQIRIIEQVEQDKKKKKILIIDDNSIILESVHNMLNKIFTKNKISHIDVIKRSDGVDLLKEIIDDQANKEQSILLTFLDEHMEYMNGNQALRILREIEERKKLPRYFVCKMSAVRELDAESECLYDYTINKPASVRDIEKLLSRLNIC